MGVKAKIILGIITVIIVLIVLILAQGGLGVFLSTRAPIESLDDPAAVEEYTAICEETCVDFQGGEKKECVDSCLELGADYY